MKVLVLPCHDPRGLIYVVWIYSVCNSASRVAASTLWRESDDERVRGDGVTME